MTLAPALGERRDLDVLYELLCCDPDIVVCVHRISNACLHNSWELEESGHALKPSIRERLHRHYDLFLRDCIRMMYLCGFAAFYIRRVQQLPLPFCPAIGTFTWHTRISEKSAGPNAHYDINVTAGNVKRRDIRIMPYYSPIVCAHIKTPMQAVLSQYMALQELHETIRASNKWNQEKHVVVTETMDVKDQTTSGLQLLDDVRRYTLSGEHSMMRDNVLRLKNRYNKDLRNTNEAKLEWINDQFGGGHTQGIATHVLPPNMGVVELSNIAYGNEYETLKQHYRDSVYTFFGVQNQSTVQAANKSTAEFISSEQHQNTQNISRFLEQVLQSVYSISFNVPLENVRVTISGQPRASINNTDDIKRLADAELLAPSDRKKARKLMDTL
jgi:hypothetical protein